MKPLYYYLLFLLLSSCKPTTRVQYRFIDFKGREVKVTGFIPKGSAKIKQTADEYMIYIYKYNNAVIYWTDYARGGTPNDSVMRFQKGISIRDILPDTASFNGKDKEWYWREEKRGDLFYGYSRVPASQKEAFDKAVNSIKLK